jgi:peptidoglycan/xylan/chitin deacetylase (PgdA/CDA1 family)
VLLTGWVGANTPDVSWFGATVSHGPRNTNQVALTFDDGPDATYTLAVRDILDAHDVKGTFFTVGKALDARPDISKALLDDGQLLGDHSYHHDGWRWLDPRYPELQRTQNAFERDLGVCPAFYRPPHGQRTPFISWLVHDRGMTTVTWDVSANDWASHDAAKVARDILARVKPGSIILLHDGLDGKVHADRSVLLGALPRILDGLKAKGLQPVRLDELLNKPGYVSC